VKSFLGYEIEIKVIDESNGLKEAIVKIREGMVAVIPFRDEVSLKETLEGIKVLKG